MRMTSPPTTAPPRSHEQSNSPRSKVMFHQVYDRDADRSAAAAEAQTLALRVPGGVRRSGEGAVRGADGVPEPPALPRLLEEAETEYGYAVEGPLELPCDIEAFHAVLWEIEQDAGGGGRGHRRRSAASPEASPSIGCSARHSSRSSENHTNYCYYY
uniref:Uncharacterized protein n=1 Tax=Ananas comosus var. bracteatus TaxID=296719 RepID=A0A6V7QZ41_ANACO